MAINQTGEGLPVYFSEGIIPGYNGPLLKGAAIISSITTQWEMMMQEIRSEVFTISHFFLRLHDGLQFNGSTDKAGIHSRFMLRNNANHHVDGAGKLSLNEGEYCAIWTSHANCEAKFASAGEYEALDIYYAPDLITQLADFFPGLEQTIKEGETKLLPQTPCFVTPSLKDIIRQLIECPYDEATRIFYFDIKVRELLYVILEQSSKVPEEKYKFSAYERSRIAEARNLLLENISGPSYTIRSLSRAVALNEFKLKAGFKQMYGMGVFECLTDARMEKARELLANTNKPIKEICKLAGYPRMTNFITAFRRRYGYTPGAVRRK